MAATSRIFCLSTFGSWGTVIACKSTMQKKFSYSFCIATQFLSAPT
jgi:hypothetical protein